MKRMLVLLTLVLIPTFTWASDDDAAVAGGLAHRSFKLNHKSPERAAQVIKPLISAEGSISIQPASNTLVVSDRSENIRAIAQALEQFDAPAKPFRVELKIISASRAAAPPKVPEDLRDVSAKLGAVLRFNSFEKIGELTAEGKEGDSLANLKAGETYRADLKFGEYDPVAGTLRIEDFQLSKPAQGEGEATPVLKRTFLNLKPGPTPLILGLSHGPQSERMLMLVLVAQRGE